MYQNMTREEMIQRLYEGNFTTGELERQLIAKLFEQCCGGGSSSGGGAFVTHVTVVVEESKWTMDKTAAEVLEAAKAGPVYAVLVEESEDSAAVQCRVLKNANFSDDDEGIFYGFAVEAFKGEESTNLFTAESGSDYPVYTDENGPGGGGVHPEAL